MRLPICAGASGFGDRRMSAATVRITSITTCRSERAASPVAGAFTLLPALSGRQTRRFEQPEIDRGGHRLISRVVHVQVVARVELLLNLRRLRGIAHRRVEVDYAVVRLAGPDELVHRLTFGFAFGAEIGRALERRECRAIDLQAVRVGTLDELPVPGDEILGARNRIATADADVVDALE